VWVLATSDVFPGDLASFLWAEYGDTVDTDPASFRTSTRKLLDELTHHYKRQRIQDVYMQRQARKYEGLAELVHLDRLDKVSEGANGVASMAPL